jgi:hypothetical protein
MNLKFLQLLDQFELEMEPFITNVSRDQFNKTIENELMILKDYDEVPFFVFDFAMSDKSQIFSGVTQHYQKLLGNNERYDSIDWKLINIDAGYCQRLLKLLQMSNVNKQILWNELQNAGKPNAAIMNSLGSLIINSLFKPEPSLESIIEYYIKNITQLDKSVISVLDKFVIASKNFISYPRFIQSSFDELGVLFLKHKQFKRLKNISNLFYNFACKLSDLGYMEQFIRSSLLLETILFKHDTSFPYFASKFDKCLRLLTLNSVPITNAFNVIFNNDFLQNFSAPTLIHKYDLVSKSLNIPIAFKYLSQLELSHLSEENRALVFVSASKYLPDDISAFYDALDITDPILKMLCGSYYQKLPIVRPQSQSQKVFNGNNADPLIKSFYYLSQEVRTKSTANLKKIVHLYTHTWVTRNKHSITSLEFQFLIKLVDYLNFVDFQNLLRVVITAIQKYKDLGNSALIQWLSYNEVDNQLNLGQYLHVSVDALNSSITEASSGGIERVLSYQILKLKCYLINYDKRNLIDTSKSILQSISDNMALLSTDNSMGHSKARFLEVLVLLVKLHYFRGKVLLSFGEHLESLLSFCTAIRLSKSILKQNIEKLEIFTLMSSGFRYIIKILIHLGISKDAAFYSEEFMKFNDSIRKNKSLFAQNCYFLSYYNFISGSLETCTEFTLKGNTIFDSLGLVAEGGYTDNLKLIYYKLISNIYSMSQEDLIGAKQEVERFLNSVDKESKVLSIAWRQNYEYVFNSDISLKNSNNPYIKSMDLMIIARKLFIDAQELLNVDPLFSTLEDSAMSIPSTYKVSKAQASPLKNKNMKNVKRSIMNLRQSKDIVLGLFKELRFLSNYHIDEIHKVLSLDLLTLSSISNSYNNESIEDNYRLNDYLKNQPLINEKLMIDITDNDAKNISLIPNFNFNSLKFAISELDETSIDSELLRKLPEDWLVITIDICSFNGDLIISNFEKGQKTPTFLRLPLSRHSSRTVDEESFSFHDAINELNLIIEQSNATTSKERTSSIKTPEERKQWHEERSTLDRSLKVLLTKIEYCWIGGFKGIFNQEQISDEQVRIFKDKFLKIIGHHIPSRSQKNSTHHSGSPVEIDDFVVRLFLKLGDPSKFQNTELLEDLIYFVLDILLFHGEENAYDEIDIDNIYVDVENLINEYIQSNPNPKKNKHTVLVLGKECLLIPWESLPSLRETSTTRMPSLSYLLKLFNENPQLYINKRNGSFILNPSGDLMKTEERFQKKFQEFSDDLNWKGIVREKPTENEFEESLDSNLFVYIGHGGGEQFIRSTTLKKRNKIAPSLLLGCSSAALKSNNLLEPSGTVHSYLIGGCPMIVGNLWDVTDKDIDKFSLSLFEKWGLSNEDENYRHKTTNICDAVRESRDSCNLRYLNGAAPVVYGLPLSLL